MQPGRPGTVTRELGMALEIELKMKLAMALHPDNCTYV